MRHRLTLIVTALSLLLALALALDVLPFLRGGEGLRWQWPYDPVFGRALPLLLVLALYLSLTGWLIYRRKTRLMVLAAVVGTVAITLAVLALRNEDVGYALFTRTVSGITTGPHAAGAEIDWTARRTWRDWPAVMLDFDLRSGHIALSPPGLPMVYGGLNALLSKLPAVADPLYRTLLPAQCHNFTLLDYTPAEWASAWFGMLMPLWAALGVLPLYAVARRLRGDRARYVVMVYPLIPALAMFTPTWNTVYPLFAMAAFGLFLLGLDRSGPTAPLALFAGGGLVGLLTFANFSTVPLVGLFGCYTLFHYGLNERRADNPPPLSRPLLVGLWFGLGVFAPWLVYYLVSGLTPLDLLDVALGRHLGQERPYLPWVGFHAWEWALFTGMPLVLLWLLAAVRRLRNWRWSGPVLGPALLVTLLVLLLSGLARGETGRVWLFFAPFVLLAADIDRNRLLVVVAQAVLLVALATSWRVIDVLDITAPPDSPGPAATSRPVDAVFGPLNLVGWDGVIDGRSLTLRLNWQAREPVTTPYWFAALPVAPDGTAVGETTVWQPLDARYPATCWTPGDTVGDTVTLSLPDDPSPGDWWVSLRVFPDVDRPDEQLTVVSDSGTAPDTQLGLGPIHLPE